ncbi:MAG: hypothetical protein ACFFCQ_13690 [Promethearchaeota archaeon]
MEKKEISLPWLNTKDGEKIPTFEAIINIAECLEDIAQEFIDFKKTSGRDLSNVKKRIMKFENKIRRKSSTQKKEDKVPLKHEVGTEKNVQQVSIKFNKIKSRIETLEWNQKMFEREITDMKEKLERSIDLLYKIQEALPKTATVAREAVPEMVGINTKEQMLFLENQITQVQKNQLETLRYTKAAVEGIKRLLEHY